MIRCVFSVKSFVQCSEGTVSYTLTCGFIKHTVLSVSLYVCLQDYITMRFP